VKGEGKMKNEKEKKKIFKDEAVNICR